MIFNHKLYIIAACDNKNGIGKNGTLPWSFKKDLQHFNRITTSASAPHKQNMVIMGQTTWESLPVKFRPLPKRKNLVLTRDKKFIAKNAIVAYSFNEAFFQINESTENIFIIGGGSIYKQGIMLPELDGIYLTKIQATFDCDTFFPNIPSHFSKIKNLGQDTENNTSLQYLLYTQ